MALNTGDRAIARAWSRAIYDAYPQAHGLWYASSMRAKEPAVCLCEMASPLPSSHVKFNMSLAGPALYLTVLAATEADGYAVG